MNIDFSAYKHEIGFILIGVLLTTTIILFIIGRKKFEWLVKELVKMYSDEKSYFSKKRIEGGIAFLFAFWMTIFYLKQNIVGMDIWAFGYVLTSWLFISGYVVKQIQSEKVFNKTHNGNGNGKEKEKSSVDNDETTPDV